MIIFRFKVIFGMLCLANTVVTRSAPKLRDAKWRCTQICRIARALKNEFDEETSSCKCIFKPDFGTTYRKLSRKRRLYNVESSNEQDILGQSLPVVLPISPPALIQPSLPLSAAKRMLVDIQEKFKALVTQLPASRIAPTQLDSIQASLRDLSEKLARNPVQPIKIFINNEKLIEQRKAREEQIREQLEKLKIHDSLLPNLKGFVGTSILKQITLSPPIAQKKEEKIDKSDEIDLIVPQSQKSVITQPDYLMEE